MATGIVGGIISFVFCVEYNSIYRKQVQSNPERPPIPSSKPKSLSYQHAKRLFLFGRLVLLWEKRLKFTRSTSDETISTAAKRAKFFFKVQIERVIRRVRYIVCAYAKFQILYTFQPLLTFKKLVNSWPRQFS